MVIETPLSCDFLKNEEPRIAMEVRARPERMKKIRTTPTFVWANTPCRKIRAEMIQLGRYRSEKDKWYDRIRAAWGCQRLLVAIMASISVDMPVSRSVAMKPAMW